VHIIDPPEAVEVDEHDRESIAFPFAHTKGMVQAVLKQQTVGQTGEGIVERLKREALVGAGVIEGDAGEGGRANHQLAGFLRERHIDIPHGEDAFGFTVDFPHDFQVEADVAPSLLEGTREDRKIGCLGCGGRQGVDGGGADGSGEVAEFAGSQHVAAAASEDGDGTPGSRYLTFDGRSDFDQHRVEVFILGDHFKDTAPCGLEGGTAAESLGLPAQIEFGGGCFCETFAGQ
jgi:hypothetical protein